MGEVVILRGKNNLREILNYQFQTEDREPSVGHEPLQVLADTGEYSLNIGGSLGDNVTVTAFKNEGFVRLDNAGNVLSKCLVAASLYTGRMLSHQWADLLK